LTRPSAPTRALLLTAAMAAACRSESAPTEKDQDARGEAGRVAHQVKTLRDADNAQKPVLLKALDGTPCTVKDVCAVKTTCSEAYALQEAALAALSTVRHSLQELAPGMEEQKASLLAQAEAALGRAKDLAAKCADAEAALRRHYKL
jgi:hypothetical protein